MQEVLRANFDESATVKKFSSFRENLNRSTHQKSTVFQLSDNFCHTISLLFTMYLCYCMRHVAKFIIFEVKWLTVSLIMLCLEIKYLKVKNNN